MQRYVFKKCLITFKMNVFEHTVFTCRQNGIGILTISNTTVMDIFHLFPSKLRNFEKYCNLLCLKTRGFSEFIRRVIFIRKGKVKGSKIFAD